MHATVQISNTRLRPQEDASIEVFAEALPTMGPHDHACVLVKYRLPSRPPLGPLEVASVLFQRRWCQAQRGRRKARMLCMAGGLVWGSPKSSKTLRSEVLVRVGPMVDDSGDRLSGLAMLRGA